MGFFNVAGLTVRYDGAWAVDGVSFSVEEGESLTIVGPNGAGKSSLLRAISRLVPSTGDVTLDGDHLTLDPVAVVRAGVVQCPERRRLFPDMTTSENLELGAYAVRDRALIDHTREWVLDAMPRLAERRRQVAGTLSGGEQQMLAIARAVMSQPRVLLLDEPTQGLAQIVKNDLVAIVQQILQRGVAIVTVEQDAGFAIEISQRVVIMEGGSSTFEGSWSALRDNVTLREAYFGMS